MFSENTFLQQQTDNTLTSDDRNEIWCLQLAGGEDVCNKRLNDLLTTSFLRQDENIFSDQHDKWVRWITYFKFEKLCKLSRLFSCTLWLAPTPTPVLPTSLAPHHPTTTPPRPPRSALWANYAVAKKMPWFRAVRYLNLRHFPMAAVNPN